MVQVLDVDYMGNDLFNNEMMYYDMLHGFEAAGAKSALCLFYGE